MNTYRLDFFVELVSRRLRERYVGSTYILLWVFLSPLIPLVTNLLVFFFIAGIPSVRGMGVPGYAAFIFTGLLPYRLFQKAATEGCSLIVDNMEMLKNAVFPLPILSLVSLGGLLVEFLLQCLLLLGLLLAAGTTPTLNILLLAPALLLFFLAAVGSSWLISVAGYLSRDVQEIVGVVFSALIYLTPTMYPATAAPGRVQNWIQLNPMTHVVAVFRDALLPDPGGPHPASWLIVAALAAVSVSSGWLAIRKVQRFAGDLA